LDEVVGPRTPLEQLVGRVWQEVLGLTTVSVTDNFFDLGGHSLKAAQVTARLRDALGHEIPLALLFQAPTVHDFVQSLAEIEATSAA
jgi:acyl carrier protein